MHCIFSCLIIYLFQGHISKWYPYKNDWPLELLILTIYVIHKSEWALQFNCSLSVFWFIYFYFPFLVDILLFIPHWCIIIFCKWWVIQFRWSMGNSILRYFGRTGLGRGRSVCCWPAVRASLYYFLINAHTVFCVSNRISPILNRTPPKKKLL